MEKLIANIAMRSDADRKIMRQRALDWLQTGNATQLSDAKQLLEALEDFESSRAEARSELVASLVGASLAQRVIIAFSTDRPSATEEKLIQVLLDNPGGTCAELSGKIGWAPNTWDMGFGALCGQRSLFLHALSGTSKEGRSNNLPLLTLQHRREDGVICYSMKSEAIEAFEQLGFRTKSRDK